MIGTDCTGSCKSNYHMSTTTTVPKHVYEGMSLSNGLSKYELYMA